MPKPVETKKPICHDDRPPIFKRSGVLELLGTADAVEGVPMEWMLTHAEQNGGRT